MTLETIRQFTPEEMALFAPEMERLNRIEQETKEVADIIGRMARALEPRIGRDGVTFDLANMRVVRQTPGPEET